MPATEQTWRQQKLLHVVFGVAGIVMLVVTVWMFAKDHAREWKEYQEKTADFEQVYTQGQINEIQTATFAIQLQEKKDALAEARSAPIEEKHVTAFKEAVARDIAQRNEFHYERAGTEMPEDPARRYYKPHDFSAFDELYPQLQPAAEAADEAEEAAAAATGQAQEVIDTAKAELETASASSGEEIRDRIDAALAEIESARQQMRQAQEEAASIRQRLVGMLRKLLDDARLREDVLLQQRKFKNADITAAVSELGLAQGKGDQVAAESLQEKVETLNKELAEINERYEWASSHRKRLEVILQGGKAQAGITTAQDEAAKELESARTELNRLHERMDTLFEKASRVVLGAPILDAFNTTDIRIEQIWLPELTINYNFSDVARFDRCISCHRSIDRTQPGSAVHPKYEHQQPPARVLLATPPTAPLFEDVVASERNELVNLSDEERILRYAYGLRLAEEGVLDPDDVLVQVVWPKGLDENISSRAAEAGLQVGDVITQINGRPVVDRLDATNQLARAVDWGEPIALTVQRGVPHPYATHPRLDLYVGSLSPHKKLEMGCTICHEGQGSATSFKWASHTPNSPTEALDWARDHGWFYNHHWIYPMNPKRFLQSGCLKCHHGVTELQPSPRFPDPPAPKLMQGYHLIEQYGCFGCHEINGYDGPASRLGPDLRAEPNYHAHSANFLALTHSRRDAAEQLLGAQREAEAPLREEYDTLQDKIQELQQQVSALTQQATENPDKATELAEQMQPLNEQMDQLKDEARVLEEPLDFVASRRLAVQRRFEALEEMRRHGRRVVAAPEENGPRRELVKLVEIDQAFDLAWDEVPAQIEEISARWRSLREQLAEPNRRYDEMREEISALRDRIKQAKEKAKQEAEAEKAAAKAEDANGAKQDPGAADDEGAGADPLAQLEMQLAKLNEDRAALREKIGQLEAQLEQAEAKMAAFSFSIVPTSVQELLSGLDDVETPGTYRRAGPSLRYLASKNDYEFLYSWIRKPSDFRPDTRMPQFFGLWEHLEGEPLHTAEAYEPLEIRGITEYLLAASDPFEYLPEREGDFAEPSAERGKHLFQTRGCLACHAHQDFPGIKADHGPDLSRIGAKLDDQKGRRWLSTWLRDPKLYHARTKMPDMLLEPTEDAEGNKIDPAGDIAAYLLQSGKDWRPVDVPPAGELSGEDVDDLYELALSHLSKAYPSRQAKEYLENGITDLERSMIKGDDIALYGETTSAAQRVRKQLLYVGRRAISKYGCFGCHDIPGYENAKPIGTGLADWGRKEPSKLAFEHISTFLGLHGHGGVQASGDHDHGAEEGAHAEPAHGLSEQDRRDPDVAYFLNALEAHDRQGFLWQKLRMPRSYDYLKTKNKGYNERLRMPLFPFTAEQREAVMTFVLGLVSEPPAEQFVYTPQPRTDAIVQGRKVLDKFNCAGCHVIDLDRWEFDFLPDDERFQPVASDPDYPFLANHFTPEQVEESLQIDRRGRRHATVYGQPMLNQQTGKPDWYDSEGDPIDPEDLAQADETFAYFELWQPALVNGSERQVGSPALFLGRQGAKIYPGWGGDLTRYLYPVVLEDAKQRSPKNFGAEAFGWLPPPLHLEGAKVQTQWMHDFLLEPYPIRPAAVLRMPKFNLSPEDASRIADYFAARDNARYPYLKNPASGTTRMADAQTAEHQDPTKIVISKCVQCHKLGDYTPKGSDLGLAPNLDQVHTRLRPTYLRDWIANPKKILPYTAMPVNIPYKTVAPHYGGVEQSIYEGSSIEQVAALVEFLMNYDQYTKQRVTFTPAIEEMLKQQQQQGQQAGQKTAATDSPTPEIAQGE